MSNFQVNTAIDALSANVLDTKYEDLDQVTVQAAKDRIIDIIGCAIGGANEASNLGLLELFRDWGGKGEATVFVHGDKIPAHHAAMINSIICRSYDFEAMMGNVGGKNIGSHFSGTTIPTALAVGEARGVSGKELITAILVGDDFVNRMLLSYKFNIQDGWGGAGVMGVFGAAAIAGRLSGLDKNQIRNAFGLALNMAAGTIDTIWDGATAFKLPQGSASLNGVLAAQMAKKGWTGPKDALLGKFGYYKLYSDGCSNPEQLTLDLGKIYYAENGFKPYPCCRATHPTIDSALEIVTKNDINTDYIDSVTIYIARRLINSFVGKPFQIRDFPHCDAIFSLQYTCATALINRSVKPKHFTDKAIRDPQINALISKIKLAEIPEGQKGVRVSVRLKDGKEFSAATEIGKGDAYYKPLSKGELLDKFMDQVKFSNSISQKKAELLLDKIESLENVTDIHQLTELFVA